MMSIRLTTRYVSLRGEKSYFRPSGTKRECPSFQGMLVEKVWLKLAQRERLLMSFLGSWRRKDSDG